jgi:[ribosomal protein S18]-alanine N-acetyltransferase
LIYEAFILRASPTQSKPKAESDLFMRPMMQKDLSAVMEVERLIYPFPWSEANFRDSIKAGYDAWMLFDSAAADSKGDAFVGYCLVMWSMDEIHILNFSIDQRQQRQGWGLRMIDWLARDGYHRGARALLLEVRPSNLPAICLYEKAGFVELGRRKNYYPSYAGNKEDAIVMQASLPLRPIESAIQVVG